MLDELKLLARAQSIATEEPAEGHAEGHASAATERQERLDALMRLARAQTIFMDSDGCIIIASDSE